MVLGWWSKSATLRTCRCGCKRRRKISGTRERRGRHWVTTLKVQCRNAGCGQPRVVEFWKELG